MESEGNTQTVYLLIHRDKHQMTCVYVKVLAPLEFLLLLLLCLLSGQLGLLNLFFSLLPFLVVLHCLLKRQREIKIRSFK